MKKRFNFILSGDLSDFVRGYKFKYDTSFTQIFTKSLLLLVEDERAKQKKTEATQ